jgi:ABC-type transporter Mla subunit MlaD
MALQDLTPQLRTRLSRMERAVGWFVFLATALLLFGFGYYLYHTAKARGWFVIKAKFFCYVQSSTGLGVGDPVTIMGFPSGQIVEIHPMPPGDRHNVRVEFEVRDPYFHYIWRDGSFVKVNASGLLDKRLLEVTRGTNGPAICVTQPGVFKAIPELKQIITEQTNRWQLYQDVLDKDSNVVFRAYEMLTASNLDVMAQLDLESNAVFVYDNTVVNDRIVGAWHRSTHRYVNYTPDSQDAWLPVSEAPPVSDQLQAMVNQVQQALPGILSLTNKLNAVLDNAVQLTSNLNVVAATALPAVTNFSSITATANTNLPATFDGINRSLDNLANITSNLNTQVEANSNMLSTISRTIEDSDTFIQGLKHHWLLRSAFKTPKTNAPPASADDGPPSPKGHR